MTPAAIMRQEDRRIDSQLMDYSILCQRLNSNHNVYQGSEEIYTSGRNTSFFSHYLRNGHILYDGHEESKD